MKLVVMSLQCQRELKNRLLRVIMLNLFFIMKNFHRNSIYLHLVRGDSFQGL